MQYKAKNPEEYLNKLDDDWRKVQLMLVRAMILDSDGDLKEDIEYKMLSYKKNGESLFHLNAQRNYVSLYVGNIDKIAEARQWLRDFDMGKGCIRVSKNNDLQNTGLQKFIHAVIAQWSAGVDTRC